MKKKTILIVTAILLLLSITIGTTLAFGDADTPESDTNFTITINDATQNCRMIPGKIEEINISHVSVKIDRDAWLYAALLDETEINGKQAVEYTIANGWTELKNNGANVLCPVEEGKTAKVYYRPVLLSGGTNQSIQFLKDNQVRYSPSLTNEDLSGANVKMTVWVKSVQQMGFADALAAYNGEFTAPSNGHFVHVLPNTGTYLYRAGNANAIALGSLFEYLDEDNQVEAISDPNSVQITVTRADASIDNTAALQTYTKHASDWKQSTIKFSGEGPVTVTISVGGASKTLNLEVINATNITTNAQISSGKTSNIVLLNDVALTSGANPTWSNCSVYGNGFTIDASAGQTKYHGVINANNANIDNIVINGPVMNSYEGSYGNDYYASTVCTAGNCTVTNSRITMGSSPLRVREGQTVVEDTVLSGGIFCNLEMRGGKLITQGTVTTVNTQNSLGIVVSNSAQAAEIELNGDLVQHNFISQNVQMSDSAANTLKNNMFGSNYTQYQFTSGGTKYVNTGIISMSSSVGAANIVDNRADKKNYAGSTASILSYTGYVYTMTNANPAMLETSYTEPAYDPSVQVPYPPVFSWAMGSQNIAAGGDAHQYKDGNTMRVQFLQGNSTTIDLNAIQTCKKYNKQNLTPTEITCKKSTGVSLNLTNNKVTFTDAGSYTITYVYVDNYVYDYQLQQYTTKTYTYTIPVEVNVKQGLPNASITASSNTGEFLWGKTSGFDPDYHPAAAIFDNMTIIDYNDDGTPFTVLDGSNQSTFISSIASIDIPSNTQFTLHFANGTKLVVDHAAPAYGDATQIMKYNGKVWLYGTKVWNNPGNTTWRVTKYTYTGRNGVNVVYSTARSFSGTANSSAPSHSSFSAINNVFLIYDAQGGSVSPAYTSSSPATLPLPTKTGVAFKEWNTAADGSGTGYAAGARYTFNSTRTLYAIYRDIYTVTFNANGGTCATASLTDEAGPVTLPTATNGSMTLEGWFTAAEGGTKIGSAGETYSPTGDITLYAQWSNNLLVTYNANGGTCDTASSSYDGTTPVTLPTPTRTGWTCTGWFTATSGGTKVGNAGASYAPTNHITLYAQWSQNTYTVSAGSHTNGATLTFSPSSAHYGDTITYTPTDSDGITSVTIYKTSGGSTSNYYVKNSSVTSGRSYTFTMPDYNVTILVEGKAASSGGCVPSGTMVTMADGTKKPIEEVVEDDHVMVFNHETGKLDTAGIIFIERDGVKEYNVVTMKFSDGTSTRLIDVHGYFDLTARKYVYITTENYREFIGHRFCKFIEKNGSYVRKEVIMTDAKLTKEVTGCFSFPSNYHLNFFADDFISMPGGIEGMFNFFDFDPSLRYNQEKRNTDIQTYGLFEYEVLSDLISEEEFNQYPAQYLNVSIGKGMMTEEWLEYLISRYIFTKRS